MNDVNPVRSSTALMGAIDAAGRGSWTEVVAWLNSDRSLTPCTVCLCLGKIIATAGFTITLDDDEALRTEVVIDGEGEPDPMGLDMAERIAAIVAGIGNGDNEGAHLMIHGVDRVLAHEMVGHMLSIAARVLVVVNEEQSRDN